LWSGLDDEPKFHLVNWKKVCSPIHLGGLGIRSLSTFNQSSWVSGCGDLLWRERIFGARLWIKSMGVWQQVDVLRGPMKLMR
jgi:hypothetical protein